MLEKLTSRVRPCLGLVGCVGLLLAGCGGGSDGLEGPPGPPGLAGDAGLDGRDGQDGNDGNDGRDGEDGEDGAPGAAGPAGEDGSSCTVTERDGTKTIACEDGTEVVVSDGDVGPAGTSCSVMTNDAGSPTVTCEDGTSAELHDGLDALLRMTDEPPGEHCEYGGTAVAAGRDGDRDGVLDDDEVEVVSYQCADAPPCELETGDVRIDSAAFARVHAAAACRRVAGDVIIEGVASAVVLSSLEEIAGDLIIVDTGASQIRLERLAAVGGEVSIRNNDGLTQLTLERLESVGDDLELLGNDALEQLDVPAPA